MTRKVVEHLAKSKEHEELQIVTIYETGITKQQVKQMNRYTKKIDTLIFNKRLNAFEYKKA